MAGPSLSQILDAPRTHPDAALLAQTPNYTQSAPASFPIAHRGALDAAPQQPTTIDSLSPAGAVATQYPVPIPPQLAPTSNPTTPSSAKGHAGGSLYACGDCGRRYSRPEHLQRHVQTHTLGRRFPCSICGKCFARADLRKRHEAGHDSDSNKKRRRTTTSPGVGRVSHACRACAAARVKCQEDKPCQRCVRRGLTCVSATEANSAAAMHLMHLSANAHSASNSQSPDEQEISSPSASYSQPALSHTVSFAGGNPQDLDQGSSLSQTPSVKPEEGQLLTPDTVMEQGNPESYPAPMDASSNMIDVNKLPFSDFLQNVIFDQSFDASKLVESQGLAVLDFCDDGNVELTDIDFGLLDHFNGDGFVSNPVSINQDSPLTDTSVDISQMRQNLVQIWTDSPWRWDPKKNDSTIVEQGNLPVPDQDTSGAELHERRKRLERMVNEKLDPSARDRVLAIVLAICRQLSTSNRVAASFPSVDVMDTLVHIFLNSHACQVSEWIHFPTLRLNAQEPEWIATAAAGGAMLTPFPTLRKFGLALQGAVRLSLPPRFDEDNPSIKNLGLVQSLVLEQDIALWCGNRRKMEIAECHLVIPVTMMRYRRKFQRSSYPIAAVESGDVGQVLQEKWKSWIEMEQWKRLIFHCYLRDAQTSMTALTNPAMSYSELTLPLPESRELWFAKSASEWKALYLERNAGQVKRAPAVGDLIQDISLLATNRHRLDVQFSASVLIHAYWTLILEYRQLSAVFRTRSYTNVTGSTKEMVLASRHQELVKELVNLHSVIGDWPEISAQERLVIHALMMNLNISLDDLQLFAGKEGDEQARRIYPVLQQWSESTEARTAIWCAGQILACAKLFPPSHLKDFYAVAVHHAALAIWTYGVVSRANRRQPLPQHADSVHLDGRSGITVQAFINFNQGRPLIRGPLVRGGSSEAAIDDPRACMEMVQEILKANFMNGQEGLPPIVENLCVLIRQLGNAAWTVGLG